MKKFKLSYLLLLIIIIFYILLNIKIYYYFVNKKQDIINIKEIVNKSEPKKETITIESTNNYSESNYIGYIEIKSCDIKKPIMLGTEDKILNKNVVGLYDGFSLLDDSTGNIILAGHNNSYVFHNLFNISIGDEINIYSRIKEYKYVVKKIKIISANDYSIFTELSSKKYLILITCVDNSHRLVVFAE